MKKYILLVAALLIAGTTLGAEKHLSALFGYSVFYLPDENLPYVETYLDFDARSLNLLKESDNGYRATVEVTLVVRKNDTVEYLKKYDLKSPFTASPEMDDFTFFDLHRFALKNGIYDLEISMKDKASSDKPFVLKEKLYVYYVAGRTAASNVQLMASVTPTDQVNNMTRNGYEMMPYINDFVPAEVSVLYPYMELYNVEKEVGDKPYHVAIHIEQSENGRIISGTYQQRSYTPNKQLQPIVSSVDVSNLPSGNYKLVVEALNNANDPFFRKEVFFQRSNPDVVEEQLTEDMVAVSFAALITDEQKLNYYIRALYPISSPQEISVAEELLPQTDLAAKQTYFYRFWITRNAMEPENEWNKYYEKLKYVDENFSYPKTPGFLTDRGRIYLQYGPPDYVRDEKNFVGVKGFVAQPKVSSNTDRTSERYNQRDDNGQGHVHYLPYIIWRYNRMENDFPNRVFLFWDEHRSGYYKLLNSNARGELRTPGWERMLCRNQLEEEVLGDVGHQFERGM